MTASWLEAARPLGARLRGMIGKRPRSYLIAGSGGPNFGDELITRAWLDELARRGWQVTLDGNGGPRVAGAFHALDRRGVEAVVGVKSFANTRVANRVSARPEGAPRLVRALRLGLDAFAPGGVAQRPALEGALDALGRSDRIHLSGGGYINSWKAPHSAFLIGFVAAAARHFGLPAYATGLGLTPLKIGDPAAALLAEAISAFALFEVRDAASHRALWRRGRTAPQVICGLDDSWLAPLKTRRDGRRRLHLSFLSIPDEGPQAALHDAAAELAAEVDEAVEWACTPRHDPFGRRAVEARLGRGVTSLDARALTYRPIPAAPGDLMISQRFHPHLIAARLGVFGAYAIDNEYYEDKHLSVVQLGSPWRRFSGAADLREAAAAADRAGPERLDAREAELRGRKRRIADAIYGA